MKSKSHSGIKKRVKVKGKGTLMTRKCCKQHLLSDKSKRGKKASPFGLHVVGRKKQDVKRMLPGLV